MTSPLLKQNRFFYTKTEPQAPIGKNPTWLILAFCIPFLVMALGFAFSGVRPFAIPVEWLLKQISPETFEGFADRQMLYSDLREQYYPFLQEFHGRLQEGESLFWSWNGGMGTDYGSLIAYYIASPLNLLTVFFPAAILRDVMTVLLTIKVGCAGLFSALMLRNIFRKNDVSITFFGWMYAFCSFIMGYYWDTIWMDTVALLPLVFLGLYKLVTEGKFKLYIVSLALAILCNYYLGVFVCYFCVIAFFAIAAIKKVYGRPFLGRFLQFGGCSILAGGLTAFLLLHTIFALGYTDSAAGGGFGVSEFYDSYLEVIGNMLAFNKPTAMEGLPNLYCGVLPLLLAVIYIRSKKITLSDKIINCLFLAFFIFSSNFNVLDFILHGFRFPNMLPGRYTFLISFVILLIGYRGYLLLKDLSSGDLFGIAGLGIVMVGLSCTSLGTKKTMANIILIAAYLLFLFLYERKYLQKAAFTTFLCIMISAEMIASITLSMHTVGKTSYFGYPYRQEEITQLNQVLENRDPEFWRTEMSCRYYHNDGAMYAYRGIGQFSSTANRNVTKFLSSLGFTTGANSYYYNYSTPINNTLLGIKYITSRSGDLVGGSLSEFCYEENNLKVFENTAFLGAGFMVDDSITEFQYSNSPFQVQNRLFQHLTGSIQNIFFSRPAEKYEHYNFENFEVAGASEYRYTTGENDGTLDLTFKAENSGTYYAYMRISGGGSIKVYTESGGVYNHPVAELRYIAPICQVTANEEFRVRISVDPNEKDQSISFYCYYFNEGYFNNGWKNLADETWNPTDFSDTHLKGDITVLKDGLFCTVIPYTEDWKLYVDGVETEIKPMLGGDYYVNGEYRRTYDAPYIGAYLTEGTHTVELRYVPKGFTEGVIISVTCLVIFLFLAFRFRKGFPTFRDRISVKKTVPTTETAPNEPTISPESAPEAESPTAENE